MSELEYCENCVHFWCDELTCMCDCKLKNYPEWNSEYECWECEDKKEVPDVEN